jgi:hypothetical protein
VHSISVTSSQIGGTGQLFSKGQVPFMQRRLKANKLLHQTARECQSFAAQTTSSGFPNPKLVGASVRGASYPLKTSMNLRNQAQVADEFPQLQKTKHAIQPIS